MRACVLRCDCVRLCAKTRRDAAARASCDHSVSEFASDHVFLLAKDSRPDAPQRIESHAIQDEFHHTVWQIINNVFIVDCHHLNSTKFVNLRLAKLQNEFAGIFARVTSHNHVTGPRILRKIHLLSPIFLHLSYHLKLVMNVLAKKRSLSVYQKIILTKLTLLLLIKKGICINTRY